MRYKDRRPTIGEHVIYNDLVNFHTVALYATVIGYFVDIGIILQDGQGNTIKTDIYNVETQDSLNHLIDIHIGKASRCKEIRGQLVELNKKGVR